MYRALFAAYGPQGWWPGRTPFEVIVGTILTQNTNWRNVERAIENLRAARALAPGAMAALSPSRLAALVRPAGYYRVKAFRLGNMLRLLFRNYGGSVARLLRTPDSLLREALLSVNGIGPETADSILLYAGGRPAFVIDAYTRRVLSRHGLCGPRWGYGEVQAVFTGALPPDAGMFNEYHALLVRLGKERCRPRAPHCGGCPLGKEPVRGRPGLPFPDL